MSGVELIGMLAAVLCTAGFVPQAVKTLRSGNVAGLSLATYAMLTTGIAFWVIYGLLIHSRPLVLANFIGFIPNAIVLFLLLRARLRHGRGESR